MSELQFLIFKWVTVGYFVALLSFLAANKLTTGCWGTAPWSIWYRNNPQEKSNADS